MRGMLGRVAIALLLVAGCSGDDENEPDDQARPPARCQGDGRSSPATFDSQHGTYSADELAIDDAARSLTFDVLRLLSGEDAVEAYHREHPDDPGSPPNDYWIVDDDGPGRRRAAVDDDAPVWLVRLATTGNASLEAGALDELPTHLADAHPTDVYWLTFDGGTVTEICEQYRP